MHDGMVKNSFTISNQVKNSPEKVVVSTVSLQLRDTFTNIYSKVQTTGYTQEREGQIRLCQTSSREKTQHLVMSMVSGLQAAIVKMFIGLSSYF